MLAPLPITAIRRFLENEAAGDYVLMAAAALAMAAANSPPGVDYAHLLHREYAGISVLHWINDGLMALCCPRPPLRRGHTRHQPCSTRKWRRMDFPIQRHFCFDQPPANS
jgi:hypothetical protein